MKLFFKRLMKGLHDPSKIWMWIVCILSPLLPDKLYLNLLFHHRFGKWIDWKNPKGFNEKLQWLKVYDRKPEYTTMVDKVAVKDYVAKIIGEEYIIPTIGVWENPDDIDFDALPDQFVLKCNHNSGIGLCICKDKSKLDINAVKSELRRGLKQDFYLTGREWPYKNVPRKILAEKYMEDEKSNDGLNDYKLLCFNGQVTCSFVCSERYGEEGLKVTFYDKDWKRLPFERHYPSAKNDINMPAQYHKMVALAERLSQSIPFVRTDFYEINGNLYFGEMTFYPGSGLEEFSPEVWDEKLGKLIQLPGGGYFIESNGYALRLSVKVSSNILRDYKFFCFGGEPKFLYISDSQNHILNFLKTDWTPCKFSRDDYTQFGEIPEKPECLSKMLAIARKLSEGIPHVRIDLYYINKKIYFGELTFYTASGLIPFNPKIWDEKLGKMIKLSH